TCVGSFRWLTSRTSSASWTTPLTRASRSSNGYCRPRSTFGWGGSNERLCLCSRPYVGRSRTPLLDLRLVVSMCGVAAVSASASAVKAESTTMGAGIWRARGGRRSCSAGSSWEDRGPGETSGCLSGCAESRPFVSERALRDCVLGTFPGSSLRAMATSLSVGRHHACLDVETTPPLPHRQLALGELRPAYSGVKTTGRW